GFYSILDQIMQNVPQNILLIEFLYLLLSLGFEGRFFAADKVIREEIRSRVFQRIRQSHGKVTRMLSDHWQDKIPAKSNKNKKSSIRISSISSGLVAGFLTLLLNFEAYNFSSSLINDLKHVGLISAITTYSQLINRPIIRH